MVAALATACPAWAAECRTGISTDLKWDSLVDVTTNIQNTRYININNPSGKDVDVRVYQAQLATVAGEKLPAEVPAEAWTLMQDWKTLKAATADSFGVRVRIPVPKKADVTQSQSVTQFMRVEIGQPDGMVKCQYHVANSITTATGLAAHSTIYFEGCTSADGVEYGASCKTKKFKSNRKTAWSTDYEIIDLGTAP